MVIMACVVVSFNPDITYFTEVISRILENKVPVYVVDNGSTNIQSLAESLPEKVYLHKLGENVGIAKAQNIGIDLACKNGADYIWLSDQDTVYPADFSEKMLRIAGEMKEQRINFGALGPSFFELNRKRIEAFVKFGFWSKRFKPELGLNKVAHLIASGMVIPKDVFDVVGFKREDLFIDWVDLEWCWRANKLGYQVYGTGDVTIEHNLGDVMVKVANKQISIRSPFRHYFIIRNGLYLCLHSSLLPLGARLHYLTLTLITSGIYPLLAPEHKLKHLQVNLLGLWHGLIARLGPKP